MISLICGILKTQHISEYNKKKQTHRDREQTSGYQWGGGEGKGAIQVWESERYKQLGVRQAQGCIVQQGEFSQYFTITVNGK